jgi:hypothetical protein
MSRGTGSMAARLSFNNNSFVSFVLFVVEDLAPGLTVSPWA